MDPIHRHCGDLCSTQDQHRIHTGSTQREHVKHKTKLRSILSIGSSLADTLSFVKVVSLSNSGSSTAYPFWRTAWQTLQVYTGLLRACTNQIWPSTKNPLATPATLSTLFSLALHVYLQDLSSPTSRPWTQWIQPNWTLADSTCYKLLLRLPQRPASPTIWLFYPMLHSVLCLSKPGLRWGHVGMETFHFLHLLEASAQFTLNQEFVKTAHDCTQLRARECACVVSMLVWRKSNFRLRSTGALHKIQHLCGQLKSQGPDVGSKQETAPNWNQWIVPRNIQMKHYCEILRNTWNTINLLSKLRAQTGLEIPVADRTILSRLLGWSIYAVQPSQATNRRKTWQDCPWRRWGLFEDPQSTSADQTCSSALWCSGVKKLHTVCCIGYVSAPV